MRLALLAIVSFAASGGSASAQGTAAPVPKNQPLATTRVFSLPGPSPRVETFIKPGHWTAVWVEASAAADFRGTLTSQWVDAAGAPLGSPPMQFRLRHEWPLVLPKGQIRGTEHLLFTPADDDADGPGILDSRESKLREAAGRFRLAGQGEFVVSHESRQQAVALRDHQALFVVLAARPEDYAFLGGFDALAAPHSPTVPPEHEAHYRTVFAADDSRALLPTSVRGWTTTAYVLWDGFDAAKLSDAQRTALVDWLHWGGVLIVAGPGTLDGAALEPFTSLLPAASAGTMELDAAALAPLVAETIDGAPPATSRPWTGVRLRPLSPAKITLGTPEAPLIVERRIGRGRIVAMAFRPSQAELVAWPSYAGFFSARMMHRPARYWRSHPADGRFVAAVWNDRRDALFEEELRVGIADRWFDPTRVSPLRFIGRGDATVAKQHAPFDTQPPIGPGVAAWRDDDELAETVRAVLHDASGIHVPPASLVLGLLAAYVTAAVPVNWLVFRSLGRTEWAWLATPVLAGVFTVVVVRAAELDLGFVRSASETTIVEIQPGYDRAHVVRHAAIYNSLGTEYAVTGNDPTFVALPEAATADPHQSATGQTFTLERRDDEAGNPQTALTGVVVDSGSVGLVRAEQMLPLGGTLRAERLAGDRLRITNGTAWELRDVLISGRGRATIAVLPAGSVVDVTLSEDAPPLGDEAGRRETIDINPLLQYFQSAPLEGLRLVAWSPTPLSGLTIEPSPSQRRQKTVVVAHLEYDDSPPAKDANTRAAVAKRVAP